MRHTIKTAILATLVMSVGAAFMLGCDFTEGFDVNPNLPTEADPGLVLAAGQVGLIQAVEGDLSRTSSMWAGNLVGFDRQFLGQQSGSASSEDWNNAWTYAYAATLGPLHMAMDIYDDLGNRVAAGVARTSAALVWGSLVSLFGDIPFSEALDLEANPTPAFDPQASVYDGVIAMLGEAIAGLESGTGTIPTRPNGLSADIFGRTPAQWAAIAHTLRARYYLHIGNFDQAVVHAQQGIQLNGDLMATHSTVFGSWNGWWAFTQWYRPNYIQAQTPDGSSYSVRLLFPDSPIYRGNAKTDEAARRAHFFTGTSVSNAGLAAGTGRFFGQATAYPLVTHIENQLILAEARLQNGNADGALAALNSARAALQEQFPEGQYDAYTMADFQAGGLANPQGEPTARALLREILEEKHISLFATIEAFNDIRRTENFLGVDLPIIGTSIPQRLIYAINEINANPNVPSPPPGIMVETPVNAAMTYPVP